MIAAIKPHAGQVPLVIHMMVTEPARHIEHIARAGGDIIVVHAEACADLPATVAAVRHTGALVGVAVQPETPIDPIRAISGRNRHRPAHDRQPRLRWPAIHT